MRRTIIAAALMLIAAATWAERERLELVEVIDADTLVVSDGTEQWEAQVYGIDAPEISEPFGEYARGLVVIVFSRGATVLRAEFDDRAVDVTYPEGPLQFELVRLGLARATEESRHWMWLRAWESEPRELGIGIWSQEE